MVKRLSSLLLFSSLGIISLHAQWTKTDSLNFKKFLDGDQEIILNPKAVNSIDFGGMLMQPQLSEESPGLKFIEVLPSDFIQIRQNKKGYYSLRPYNVFTKYDEDPIYGKATLVIPNAATDPTYYMRKLMKASLPTTTPGGGSSAGVAVVFSMEDILQYLFSKRGRAKQRNQKNANAWKTY